MVSNGTSHNRIKPLFFQSIGISPREFFVFIYHLSMIKKKVLLATDKQFVSLLHSVLSFWMSRSPGNVSEEISQMMVHLAHIKNKLSDKDYFLTNPHAIDPFILSSFYQGEVELDQHYFEPYPSLADERMVEVEDDLT